MLLGGGGGDGGGDVSPLGASVCLSIAYNPGRQNSSGVVKVEKNAVISSLPFTIRHTFVFMQSSSLHQFPFAPSARPLRNLWHHDSSGGEREEGGGDVLLVYH